MAATLSTGSSQRFGVTLSDGDQDFWEPSLFVASPIPSCYTPPPSIGLVAKW